MKKIILAVFVLTLAAACPVFAEESEKSDMPNMKMMAEKGMPYPCMMKKAAMVSTEEGGVIVLVGDKLMRYDADLNLEKTVEIPMSKEQCPMMGKMMEEKSASVPAQENKKAS